MASRYRNDYLRGIAQTGTVGKNTTATLVNKTSEESRARFSNIMNSLAQKHEEERPIETYIPPIIERESVIRDIPREINPIMEERYEPLDREVIRFRKEDNTAIAIAIIIIVVLVVIAFKLYTAQKMIDDLIREESRQYRQYGASL